jgi:hypothetical protein
VSTRSSVSGVADSIAWMPLRVRLSSTCSTMVRSHSHAAAVTGQVELDPGAALARLQAHQRQHRVDQHVGADVLAQLFATAHEARARS